MRMLRVYADDAGETHFAELDVTFTLKDFAPPAPALRVSDARAATAFMFVTVPTDWPLEWHPSPKRQIWVGFHGALRVTVSDGETREIPAGTPWLMEDKTGKGHATVAVGGVPAVGAITQLE